MKPYAHHFDSNTLSKAVVDKGERPTRPQSIPRHGATLKSLKKFSKKHNDSPMDKPLESEPLTIIDPVWNLLEKAWAPHPEDRPSMKEVETSIEEMCSEEKPMSLLSIGMLCARACQLITYEFARG
jgi:hypothetical protein